MRKIKRHYFNELLLGKFISAFRISLKQKEVIEKYSEERVRLEQQSKRLPNFDLLIPVTAVNYDMILVAKNIKHHSHVKGISIENWKMRTSNQYTK